MITPTMDAADFFAAERLRWTEKQFQREVLQLARDYGWDAYHTFDSRRSRAGWPDLTLWRDRIIFVELKATKGSVSPEQMYSLQSLQRAGATVYIWRPADWNDGTIDGVLKR